MCLGVARERVKSNGLAIVVPVLRCDARGRDEGTHARARSDTDASSHRLRREILTRFHSPRAFAARAVRSRGCAFEGLFLSLSVLLQ